MIKCGLLTSPIFQPQLFTSVNSQTLLTLHGIKVAPFLQLEVQIFYLIQIHLQDVMVIVVEIGRIQHSTMYGIYQLVSIMVMSIKQSALQHFTSIIDQLVQEHNIQIAINTLILDSLQQKIEQASQVSQIQEDSLQVATIIL